MSPTRTLLSILVAGAAFAAAQSTTITQTITSAAGASTKSASVTAAATSSKITPLASKHFEYTALPYKVDTDDGERGTQQGFNVCNSTTEGQTSLCQTSMVNSIDDFCLWGPPDPNSLIGNTEGEAVAWCTKPGRGTRLIPAGALTGVQFMKTSAYIQVTGHIKQEFINIDPTDGGGEMDPHGADFRGNPLGGLVFSNAFASNGGNNNTFQQVIEWHNFMGSNVFCIKACDPAGADAAHYCEHIYDRIGCQYNAPAAYVDNVFESCQGETQDFPGVYTGADGQKTIYTQPPESLGEISTMPYTARIPASSNCASFSSNAIYTGLPSASGATGSSSGTATATGSNTITTTRASQSGSGTASRSSSSAASTSTSNGASTNAAIGAGSFLSFAALIALAI